MPTKHTADLENKKFDVDGKVKTIESLSSEEVTALGSSTDINKWMQAYKNGQLLKKYVNSYDDEDEQEVYYTHPDLGDGYKSLKLVYAYSTQNSQQVVRSVTPSVADWSFDSGATATVTITLGSVTSPNPSSSIAVGTDVISSITITNSGGGTNTLSLSGVDASKYQLNNTTTATTGSSVTAATTDTVVIETSTDYSGASYTHNVTCTITESLYGASDSESFVVSGTYSAYSNKEYMKGVPVWYYEGVYGRLNGGGLLSPDSTFNDYSTSQQTYNFWIKLPTSIGNEIVIAGDVANNKGIFIASSSTYGDLYLYTNDGYSTRYTGYNFPTSQLGKWLMVTFVTGTVQNDTEIYVQDSSTFNSTPVTKNVNSGTGSYHQPSSSTTITHTGFFGCRTYNNQKFPTSSASMTGTNYEIEEWTSWDKALSPTEIEELHNNHQPYDYSTHSAASDLYHWIRFGDKSGDTESSISCNVHTDFTLTKNTNATGTYLTDLTYLDSPYVAASGEFSNEKYLDVTAAVNDGYVESETISHDFLSDFSMSFWVKFDGNLNQQYTDAFYFGARRGTNRDFAGRYTGFQIQYRGSSSNYLDVLGVYVQFSDPVMDDGNWHHVVITYDSTGVSGTDSFSATDIQNKFTIYVDNSTPTWGGSGGSSIGTASETLTNFRVGDFTNVYTEVDFQVDEFAYWGSTKLTSTEVGLIYNSGVPTDLENTTNVTVPTRYWRFEDGSNLTKDSISDSNQGAIGNGTQTGY